MNIVSRLLSFVVLKRLLALLQVERQEEMVNWIFHKVNNVFC